MAKQIEIQLIIDTNNQTIKAKADNNLICNVWQYEYSNGSKEKCLIEAKAAIFTEMCRLSELGNTFTVSKLHF